MRNMRAVWVGILAACCLAGSSGCSGETQAALPPDPGSAAEPAVRTGYEDVALVGNSYIDSFYIYDAVQGAAYYYRVGLNVENAFELPMVQGEDMQTPVLNLLEGKTPSHIFLFFGENELGWTNRDAFTDGYAEVIRATRGYCPEAAIYLCAIPPVSKAVSQENQDNTSNPSIRACNAEIQKVAQENDAVYVDSFDALADADGCLPADAAADGIHPAKAYTERWAELLKQSIAEAERK